MFKIFSLLFYVLSLCLPFSLSQSLTLTLPPQPDKTFQIDIFKSSIWWLCDFNLSIWRRQNEVKNKNINKTYFDILIWLDINKTTTFCTKTLRHFLLVLEVLVCLIGISLSFSLSLWLFCCVAYLFLCL
jgi:hypothetical protein